MNRELRINRTQQGQTLIIALVIMGILLVLGLVFTGIVSRNINQAGSARNRAIANDLSEAGIRYAHAQLQNSRLGADWRGELIDLAPIGTDVTSDPDMLFLRPGTNFGLRSDTDNVVDLGGPDGLGPFTRVSFENGRSLVRVRYAPSDPNVFETVHVGQLRAPGAARHYLIIESFGRNGRVNPNDPTTLGSITPIQFRNFGSSAAFRAALAEMVEADKKLTRTRKLIAFATVGLTDQALFISNRDKVTRSAEIGVPEALGVQFDSLPVTVPMVLGRRSVLPGNPADRPWGGGLRSNAPLVIHGAIDAFLNTNLGDTWQVSDKMRMETGSVNNVVNLTYFDANSGNVLTAAAQFDSLNAGFNTFGGHVRDGVEGSDAGEWWRNVGSIEAPNITGVDPQTNKNRMLLNTQESGRIGLRGNDGRFGHGQGIFVNNSQDKQNGADEDQREGLGSEGSLVYDWFNPNNGGRNSGWKGSYYVPRGAFVQLVQDGFIITRDSAATGNQRTWRRQDGSDTGSATIRYRLGFGTDGLLYVVNTYTPGVTVNGAITPAQFMNGMPFNGTMYFEGNVRIRGVIPTNVQLTVMSNATIYIEGSITKGVVVGSSRLNAPSTSMLMLMAKDYVAVNTTMFFGPSNGQNLDPSAEAVRMGVAGDTLALSAELLLNPDTTGAGNVPQLWTPFNTTYQEFGTGNNLSSDLLVTHTMDNGAGQYAMIGLDINPGVGPNPSTYLFPLLAAAPNPQTNSVLNIPPYLPGYTTPGYTIADYVPIYGLGRESWQRATKFETLSFPLMSAATTTVFPLGTNTTGEGTYQTILQETNQFVFRHQPIGSEPANDYLLKRSAITPHDIRIEASMFAEQGSFVVIPGYWFNNNANDRRDVFEANVARYLAANGSDQAAAIQSAQLDRLRDYGAGPKSPFYAEPLDVRLQVFGSISQNMPLPASYQAEWLKKWGWIPRQIGAWYRFTGNNAAPVLIPAGHVPAGWDISPANVNASHWVPNLVTVYDPVLATGRADGFNLAPTNPYVRVDQFGRPLAPMPRLPVSPTLAYFGEVLH